MLGNLPEHFFDRPLTWPEVEGHMRHAGIFHPAQVVDEGLPTEASAEPDRLGRRVRIAGKVNQGSDAGECRILR